MDFDSVNGCAACDRWPTAVRKLGMETHRGSSVPMCELTRPHAHPDEGFAAMRLLLRRAGFLQWCVMDVALVQDGCTEEPPMKGAS